MVWCIGTCRKSGVVIEFGYPDNQPLFAVLRDYVKHFSRIEIMEYIPS